MVRISLRTSGSFDPDWGPLEEAARRPINQEEQVFVTEVTQGFLAAVQGEPEWTWRKWERAFKKQKATVEAWLLRPREHRSRGPRGTPHFAELILCLQQRLSIGKQTTTEIPADDGSNKNRNDYSGRFVEFIFELVQQMKPYAPSGVFPYAVNVWRSKSDDSIWGVGEKNAIGRYIKQVRSSQTKRRSK